MFDQAQYRTELGITESSNEDLYLARVLSFVEGKLRAFGFELYATSEPAEETLVLPGYDSGRQIFRLHRYLKEASADKIVIKRYGDSDYSDVLSLNTDYKIVRHRLAPKPVIELQLFYKDVHNPYYLSVTGVWGFDSSLPADLDAEVFAFILSEMSNYRKTIGTFNRGGQEIINKSISDVRFGYAPTSVTASSKGMSARFKDSLLESLIKTTYAIY